MTIDDFYFQSLRYILKFFKSSIYLFVDSGERLIRVEKENFAQKYTFEYLSDYFPEPLDLAVYLIDAERKSNV